MTYIAIHVEKWLFGTIRMELEHDEIACFTYILARAAVTGSDPPGLIYYFSEEHLASQLQVPLELLQKTLEKCKKFKKIKIKTLKRENKYVLSIVNWEKYQHVYLHQKAYRQREKAKKEVQKKLISEGTKKHNQNITVRNIGEEKRGEERRRDNMKVESSEISPQKFSDTDIRLTNLLIEKILENNPKSSIQRMTQKTKEEWLNECRKLREIDCRTPEEIEAVICWCQEDNFEKTVVLSIPKLRKRFDELWLKFERANINKDSNQRRRIKDNGRNKPQTYVGSQQLWTKEEEKKYLPMIDKEYEENLHAYMEKEGITDKEDVDPFKIPTLTDFRVKKLNEIRRKKNENL